MASLLGEYMEKVKEGDDEDHGYINDVQAIQADLEAMKLDGVDIQGLLQELQKVEVEQLVEGEMEERGLQQDEVEGGEVEEGEVEGGEVEEGEVEEGEVEGGEVKEGEVEGGEVEEGEVGEGSIPASPPGSQYPSERYITNL
ncbi:hypothetical protein BV25DRAFT_1922128 [Artomyces pyxidatus]|uniref:Uncharacterized protein n=1 Tax=Artomyces pyxidatus TaxID=48021 RepID=A0ACB8SF32_9AGAM|nr:hypothetical protein BV25DRAFT_1922128 [Artomyces pyxidatus]